MRMLIDQLVLEMKLFMRDRQVVFWTFFFPVFLILLFGFVFGRPSSIRFGVGIVDEDQSPQSQQLVSALEEVPVLILKQRTREEVLEELRDNERNLAVIIGPGYAQSLKRGDAQVEVWYDPSSMQTSEAGISILRQVVDQINWTVVDAKPPVTVVRKPVQDVRREVRYIDYLVPGVIGMSLMSTCLFSIGVVVVSYREKGKLRRLSVTPLPKPIFIAGQIFSRYLIVLLQAFLLIGLGILVFQVHMEGSLVSFLVMLTVGLLAFTALGFLIASVAKTTQTAAGIANVIFFPMMLLSGVYFSVDGLPKFFKPLVEFLPLTHLIRASRAIFNNGVPLISVLPEMGILAVWMVTCFALSVKLFKWE